MAYSLVSRNVGHFSFATVILASSLLIAGLTPIDSKAPDSNFQHAKLAIKTGYVAFNHNSNTDHYQEKGTKQNSYAKQENEYIVATAQPYKRYEETLGKKQEMLDNDDPYSSSLEKDAENDKGEMKQAETEYLHEDAKKQLQKREVAREEAEQLMEMEEQQGNADSEIIEPENEQDEAKEQQDESEDQEKGVEDNVEGVEKQEEENKKQKEESEKTEVIGQKYHKRSGQNFKPMKFFQKIKKKGRICMPGITVNFKQNPGKTLYIKDIYPIHKYNNFKIRSAQFNCSTNSLSIDAKTSEKWTVVSNYLTLQKVTALINVQINAPQKTLMAIMNGYWRIGNLNVKTTLTFKLATKTTHIVVHPSPGTSLTSFVNSITGLSLPVASPLKVSFKFEGYKIGTTGEVFLLLTSDKHRNKFYAIYKKKTKRDSPVKAIAAELQQFRLNTLLRRLLKVDFSQTPFWGKFKVPDIGLIYSTGKMGIHGKDVFKNSPLLKVTKNTINKGFSAFMKVPFHSDPLIVKYHNRVLEITTPHKNLRLEKLLEFLLPRSGSKQITLPIPHWKKIFKQYIELIRVTEKDVTVVMSFPLRVDFFQNFLKLSKVKAEILVQNKRPKVSVKLTGNVRIAGITFKTELARNLKQKYVLKAIGNNRLDLNKLKDYFHAAILPSEIHALLYRVPFLKMSIINPRIHYTIGAKPMQLHIEGIPRIHGYHITSMSLLFVKISGQINAALAIKLKDVNLAQVLYKITRFKFQQFFILDQKLSITLTISPREISNVHFDGSLSSVPVAKGISLTAPMKFPRHCGHHKFCKFAGILIGHNTVLTLKATILSTTYYSLSATLNQLRLGKGLILYNAGLKIVGGTPPQIGLVGQVRLNNPRLIFNAGISVGGKGLTLKLSMKGCWNRAFGADWLDICDILGAVSFAPPTGITGFEIGAQVYLGYKSTNHQLNAKAHIGVSIINPIENYYYAHFKGKVTVRFLLRAFRINRHIPKPLGDSGFPKGFLGSFSALGKELPEIHLSIPKGYRLKGTLNILGLQGSADITISLPRHIDINVALPPIRIGTILEMYASSGDQHKGPYLQAKVQQIPHFKVHIEAQGYLKVLGISKEARLRITNSQYIYHVSGKVLHLFYASMRITAQYRNIQHASFKVNGEFKFDLFNDIKGKAEIFFKNIARIAHLKVKWARQALQHVQKLWNKAKEAVTRAFNKLRHFGRRLITAKIMEGCSGRSCRKMAKTAWFRRVFRRVVRHVRRHVVRHVRRHVVRHVRRHVVRHVRRHVVRHVQRHAVNLARKLREKARRLKELARQKLQRLVNIAKGAYHHAKHGLSKVTRQLKHAKDHLNHVKNAFKAGLHIFNHIRIHGIGGIINVQKLWFDISLKSASQGNFAGGIKLQFLGSHRLDLKISFNLRRISLLAKQVFNNVMDRIKRLLG